MGSLRVEQTPPETDAVITLIPHDRNELPSLSSCVLEATIDRIGGPSSDKTKVRELQMYFRHEPKEINAPRTLFLNQQFNSFPVPLLGGQLLILQRFGNCFQL